MRRSALIMVALAGVAGLVLLARRPPPNPEETAVLTSSGVQSGTPSPASGPKPGFSGTLQVGRPQAPPAEPRQEPVPPPGETAASRALAVGEDGHLVVGPNVRKFFADSLTGSSDASLATSRARLIAQIRVGLPPTAAAEAEALLDRYLTYRERARQEFESARPSTLADRQQKLQALQIDTHGAKEAGALFGGQAAGDAAGQPNTNAPAGGEVPRQQGVESGGTKPAGLAEVDTPEFRQRLDAYRADSKVIDGDASLNADQRTQAIDRLRTERFTADEQPLVSALEWKGEGEPDASAGGDPDVGTLNKMLDAAKKK